MKMQMLQINRVISLFVIGFVLLAGWISPFQVTPAAAQTGGVDWTAPVNLSNSGAAASPQMVLGSDGQFYVFWNDQYTGYMYSVGNGSDWSLPVAFVAPFFDRIENVAYVPTFVAGPEGKIYAFWLGEFNILYGSQVDLAALPGGQSWTAPVTLAYAVLSTDVVVDDTGRLHVLYIQSAARNAPAPGSRRSGPSIPSPLPDAGVYYMRSEDGGFSWSTAVALDLSPYYRSLPVEAANVQFSATNGGERVFAAWDNPARERVYAARSLDAGVTWEPAEEVDLPLEGSIVGGPNHIKLSANGDQVMRVWQSDVSGVNCSLYYQWSVDGGSTWTPRQRTLENLPGCPEMNEVFFGEDGTVFLMTSIQSQWYLLAWDGARWSSPQVQVNLSSFIDDQTFNPIDLGCRQPLLIGTQLYVLSCDEGNGRDVWFMSRSVEFISEWFSNAPAWTPLSTIISSNLVIATRPVLVADAANRIHAIWSQSEQLMVERPGTSIFYSRLEAGQWSPPQPIYTAVEGFADQPDAVIDANGRLVVVWRGGRNGQLFFTQAPADRAVINTAWQQPVVLPIDQPGLSAPSVQVDTRGVIHVAYTVPLNEYRGVYVARSLDGGANWLAPQMIFDAAAWEMVDQARMATTYDGQLYLLWTRYSLPNGVGPLGLYFARSQDGGQTWSQPETVVDKAVLWSRILGVGDRIVHRVWQELNSGQTTLWHEESTDGGQTWSRVAPVSIFGSTIGQPALSSDRGGRLHLLQLVSRGTSGMSLNSYALQHWIYDGERWHAEQNMDMGPSTMEELTNLVAAVAPDGQLGISFTADAVDATDGRLHHYLYFSSRTLEVPEGLPTPPPPPTPAPVTPSELAIAAEPTVVSTPTVTVEPSAGALDTFTQPPGGPSNAWTGSVVGLLAAGLIVLVVFVVGARSTGLRRR